MLMFIVLIVLITALITVLTCTRTCTKQYGDVIEGFDISCGERNDPGLVRSDALADNLDYQIHDFNGKLVHKRRRNKQQVDVKYRARKSGPQFIEECRDKCKERNCDMFVLDTKLRRKWWDSSGDKYYFNKCWVKNKNPRGGDGFLRIPNKNRATFETTCFNPSHNVTKEQKGQCGKPCLDEVNRAEDKLLYDRLVREKEGNPMPYHTEEKQRRAEYLKVYNDCLAECP